MASKAQLQVRVRVRADDTRYPMVAPAFHANGKIKSGHAVIAGRETEVAEVMNYYIRFSEDGKRRTENVGCEPVAALAAMQRKEAELRAKSFGLAVTVPEPAEPKRESPAKRVKLLEAVEEYLAEVRQHKRPKTYAAYSHALKLFQQGCKVEHVDEIERSCVMNFKAACEKKYKSAHTVKNLFAYTYTFLKRHGKNAVVKPSDFPKAEHNEYEIYSEEDVRKMLAACKTEKERVLVLFARGTGFRKNEMVYAQRQDIDFKNATARTKSKPEVGFRTKDTEERIVPVNTALLDALKSYAPTLKGSFLFPRKDGKPDVHIDRALVRIAKGAGVAIPKKPCHAFRVLYATTLNRAGTDPYTIQRLLGHADFETTMGYLRAVKRDDPALRAQIEAAAR